MRCLQDDPLLKESTMTNARTTPVIGIALAALICAAPALAHGWPPPVGAGTQAFGGPAGSGVADAGHTAGTGDPNVGTPVVQAPPTTGAPDRPRQAVALPKGTLGGSGTAPSKAKSMGQPWLERVRVPWTPAFLPAIAVDRYSARAGTIADAIRLSAGEGGWARDGRPVVVFAYDSTNADHRRLLSTLDADGRVKCAAHFFSCFKVDVGAFGDKAQVKDAKLSVFTSDGTLVGEVSGQRKLSAVYDLIETAWKRQNGDDLANRVAKMDALLKSKAHAEHFIPLCEAGIVCPDCGHERLDVLERIAELKARSEACDRAIDALRTVAKN
jgi:hypothetical protein